MRIAYLECFSGISGDMLVGALLHVGVSEELLRSTVHKLQLGAELRISRVDRSGISAAKLDVLINGALADALTDPHDHHHDQEYRHPENHHDNDGQQDVHFHEHAHEHLQQKRHAGRSLSVIRTIIRQADIPNHARKTATRAFELLGEVEARIHNVPLESIHFHEVGAADAIVDIVCAAVGCHALGVDEWICSPVNVGGGTVQCAHGALPVPAPATLELLRGAPLYSSGVNAELATPTGAALLRALDCRFSAFPAMQIEKIGYGAGRRDLKGKPNVLRLSVGESAFIPTHHSHQTVTVLETTLDDLSPQVLGYVSERLLAEGALDVFITPAQMKKNRPGSLVTVLCEGHHAQRLRELLFTETTTIGIRTREERRDRLGRVMVTVRTQWGDVRVKEAHMEGSITNFSPEYEDCRRIAEAHSIPLKEVQQAAITTYLASRQPAVKSHA